MTDLTEQVIAYESGELEHDDMVATFQGLIDSGMAWRLQGSYGRTAHDLIESGLCTLGETGHSDYYGNYVPSRHEIVPGSPGSAEFVAARTEE